MRNECGNPWHIQLLASLIFSLGVIQLVVLPFFAPMEASIIILFVTQVLSFAIVTRDWRTKNV